MGSFSSPLPLSNSSPSPFLSSTLFAALSLAFDRWFDAAQQTIKCTINQKIVWPFWLMGSVDSPTPSHREHVYCESCESTGFQRFLSFPTHPRPRRMRNSLIATITPHTLPHFLQPPPTACHSHFPFLPPHYNRCIFILTYCGHIQLDWLADLCRP